VEDLISKKDLLQVTGISYGQLYRWKRRGLIPEDWFIRKSTFTGQETFFPRDRILARVAKIQSMKSEDLSLDDIAGELTPDLAGLSLSAADVAERGLASRAALDLYGERRRAEAPFVLGEVLTLRVLDGLFAEGAITAEEGRAFIDTMEAGLGGQPVGEFEALLVRRAGLSLWMLLPRGTAPRLDPAARVVARIDLARRLEELKSVL
jgi:hypothetical protein